jgi:hypothetical protein
MRGETIIKERNPEYVFRFWQGEDDFWRGSFYLYGKWFFDDSGWFSRRQLEVSLEKMAGFGVRNETV